MVYDDTHKYFLPSTISLIHHLKQGVSILQRGITGHNTAVLQGDGALWIDGMGLLKAQQDTLVHHEVAQLPGFGVQKRFALHWV